MKKVFFLFVVLCVFFSRPEHLRAGQEAEVTTYPARQAGLKRVHILGMGGTIAGVAESRARTVGYEASRLPVGALVEALPGLHDIAAVSAEQFRQISSENITGEVWLALAKRVNAVLARGDVDGVVITHGTDTLEETAFFLHLTVKSEKPVILVGAIRPATALSADGELNIYNAVLVATKRESRGKGVLVVMDNVILSARDAVKTSSYRTGSFSGGEYGILGTVQGNGDVDYVYAPLKKHTLHSEFNISGCGSLPVVQILYGSAGAPGVEEMRAALAAGAAGIVVACTGNGSFSTSLKDYIRQHQPGNKGIPVVRASRTHSGPVARNGEVNDDLLNTLPAHDFSPQKARILLMLGLAHGMDNPRLESAFRQY